MFEDQSPPSVLYNYSSVGEWLPACLAGTSLKFSSRTEFNDPFDSHPAYHIDPGAAGGRYIHDNLKATPGLSPAKRVLLHKRIRNQTRLPREFGETLTEQLLDSIGILCLTEEWDEPLFWGHYAAKHAGICIGFHTDRDVFRTAYRIQYQHDLPVILRPHDSEGDMVRKAFLTKSFAWRDEKEWRIIKFKLTEEEQAAERAKLAFHRPAPEPNDIRVLTDQKGTGIYEFDPTSIASLTMGMHISHANEEFVINSIRSAANRVPVFKAVRHPTMYKIKREPVRIR